MKINKQLLEALIDLYHYTEVYSGGNELKEIRKKAKRAILAARIEEVKK